MKQLMYLMLLGSVFLFHACGDSGSDGGNNGPTYPIEVTFKSHGKSSVGSEFCSGCVTYLKINPDTDKNFEIVCGYLSLAGGAEQGSSVSSTVAQMNGCREFAISHIQITENGTVTVLSKEYSPMFPY